MKGCRPLSDAETVKLLRSFTGKYSSRDRALFLLGIKSGFRISELLSLTLGDIVQYGCLVDRVTVNRRNMKKKTEGRTVLLHPEAKKELAVWISILQAEGWKSPETWVFRSRRGGDKPISRIQAWRILQRAYRENNMTGKLGTHSMRKTFANRIYDKLGQDLARTQRALGHKNINSTVSYLSFREEEIDEAILAS